MQTKSTVYLFPAFLVCLVLATPATAITVSIPDPHLRDAIYKALNVPKHAPITQDDMKRLKQLRTLRLGIATLNGLEFATQLESLEIPLSPISELLPISRLTKLKYLDASGCNITDIRPLANLTELVTLNLEVNFIEDVSPLARLTNLTTLYIGRNPVLDISPLNHLNLITFQYDEACELDPIPLESRLTNRDYPSIFARWSGPLWPPVNNRHDLTGVETIALHDLWFSSPHFDLDIRETPTGFALAGQIDSAIRQRDKFLSHNPNMIFLLHIDMHAYNPNDFHEDWPYWIRDDQGNITETGFVDFTHPFIQNRIIQQASAVSRCGLYDGIMFDWWAEHNPVVVDGQTGHVYLGHDAEQRARDNILKGIRAATRPNFLIMGNTNLNTLPRTGPYINGSFMESGLPGIYPSGDPEIEQWLTVAEASLLWLDNNIREPRINALEGFRLQTEPADSLTNKRWMRAITTLSLTHSNGYVRYGDFWYDFWDADLGRPVGEKGQLYRETEGLYIREFTNGWAVYNHSGEVQVITLPEEAQGVASGLSNTEHALPNLDGEMYLRLTPVNPADVNRDGVVNILDLILVAQAIGTEKSEPDVNGDGVVNVFDLVQVAGAIGGGGAAPSAYSPDSSIISTADVERWLAGAQGFDVVDPNFQRGIRFLEGLLAALTPKETTLLPNYPNPFNPETWIPYHLAREAEVAITIYDTKGTLVRRLALGNQAAGHYADRGKAAYWDGLNEDGESVASGIYIYHFRAGDYAASRRMVIVK